MKDILELIKQIHYGFTMFWELSKIYQGNSWNWCFYLFVKFLLKVEFHVSQAGLEHRGFVMGGKDPTN